MIVDAQGIGTGLIPVHRLRQNFLDFYSDYVKRNKRTGNRHLACCLTQFRRFIGSKFLSPIDVTEELCLRFRKHLLDHLNGETPANYFARFKQVIKAATKQGYFRINPCADIPVKARKNKRRKNHLEVEEYIQLLNTPCLNDTVRDAFIFCCYTGLRWCDIKGFSIGYIRANNFIIQKKTDVEQHITLHPIARTILDKRLARLINPDEHTRIFNLPTANGANKILRGWCALAAINKRISWSCARLSFSILLQDARVDTATVALLIGHTSTRYVNEIYKRYRPQNQLSAILTLPNPSQSVCFYDVRHESIPTNAKVGSSTSATEIIDY